LSETISTKRNSGCQKRQTAKGTRRRDLLRDVKPKGGGSSTTQGGGLIYSKNDPGNKSAKHRRKWEGNRVEDEDGACQTQGGMR